MSQTIEFYNNTNLPIMLETWKDISSGLSQTFDICIDSGSKQQIYSSTGEWKLHTMFNNSEHNDLWSNYIYDKYINKEINSKTMMSSYLGKFRNKPCASGDYSWLDTYLFDVEFKNNQIIFTEASCNKMKSISQ